LNRLACGAGWSKRCHPHGLRHTFAVNLARNGVPAAFIQRQLGHESLATTSIYLASISTADIAESMKQVSWQ
jgi:integrase/recombinase XerD